MSLYKGFHFHVLVPLKLSQRNPNLGKVMLKTGLQSRINPFSAN